MNEFQKAQNAKILSCYNTDENLSELQKAEILDIEKGGRRALIGEKRTFGGREYIKTAEGWKFHGKGTGTKAQEHAAGATTKTEEKVESTSRPKVDEIYTHPESGKKYRVRAVDEKSGKIKYKQEGSELTQETDIKKFTEMLKPASESPKAEESKLQGKVGEKITVSGYYESPIEAKVTRSTPTNIHIEFSNGDGLTIPKEHYLKGVTDHGYKKDAVKLTPSTETPKTERVAEEKKEEVKNKSIQYDIAESFAKKFNIDCESVVDKYTGKTKIEYKGSASDFMNQLKKKAFTQITKPADFSEKIRNKVDIEVYVHTDGAKGVPVIYHVEPNK